ncbi:MAG TPA: sigma-70 family RNA polymerase sigma factor [Gemmataceae bacterium]|jgi:RNA polymerase sigma-70 factor (ECF subfamily)|nr:sigma-70 family RNA polymerase sigma factor [Gemmataceae bacterium]
MSKSPPTRPSLLIRLRDAQDAEAWSQFVDIYGPLVYGFARKHGLQDADAADLMQDVLATVSKSAGHLAYDRQRGSFRGWLFTVARNRLRRFFKRQKRSTQPGSDPAVQSLLDNHPAPPEEKAQWDQEYDTRLLTWAAEQARRHFRESSWQAFWQTTMQGRSAQEVAGALGMSVGAVYVAKSRVVAHLKKLIQQVGETHGQS